jgi:hypothetical protein
MNVHLIKSNNLSEELYLQVAELLKSVNGPIQFHCAPKYEVYFNYEELVPKEIEDKNMFEKKGVPSPMSFNKAFMREERSFPLERREASWDLLFKECHTYRRLYRIIRRNGHPLVSFSRQPRLWIRARGAAFIKRDDSWMEYGRPILSSSGYYSWCSGGC